MDSSSDDTATSRKAQRDSLFLTSAISVVGAREPLTLRVRNLSPGGMMVDADPALYEGVQLVADLRGIGLIEGHVAWARDGRAGIAFAIDIDPKRARTALNPRPDAPPIYKRPPVDASRRPGLKIRG